MCIRDRTHLYQFPGESKMVGHQVSRSSEELVDYYDCLLYTSRCV